MKRTVLVNGEEVDLRDMIAEPKSSLNRVFGENAKEAVPEEAEQNSEIEKMTIILEISIRSHFRERHF
jgi:hypothetical protein